MRRHTIGSSSRWDEGGERTLCSTTMMIFVIDYAFDYIDRTQDEMGGGRMVDGDRHSNQTEINSICT